MRASRRMDARHPKLGLPDFGTKDCRNRLQPISVARGHPSRRRAAHGSSERVKESNLGWRGRMTFRDRSPGGNFDSRLLHFGVEYSTFWGLATPSGDSFTRSE